MIDQPCTVYESAGSRKSMPVSYAMRKSGKLFPLDDVVLPPPELDVLELLLLEPPPPHPAAISARPVITVAASSHIPRFVRIKSLPPGLFTLSRRRRTPTPERAVHSSRRPTTE